jgi:hypothetical protein
MQDTDLVDILVEGWNGRGPLVPRNKTDQFTSGAISGRTVANEESKDPDNKVPGRMLVGRNVTYLPRPYAEWLVKRFFKKI